MQLICKLRRKKLGVGGQSILGSTTAFRENVCMAMSWEKISIKQQMTLVTKDSCHFSSKMPDSAIHWFLLINCRLEEVYGSGEVGGRGGRGNTNLISFKCKKIIRDCNSPGIHLKKKKRWKSTEAGAQLSCKFRVKACAEYVHSPSKWMSLLVFLGCHFLILSASKLQVN